jgi:glyoxylase-like metal-dependent hydrolase (beta-lactamase superfamily II)
VAEGVLWLRMQLPFVLNHVNVWALRDHDGWTAVDTGVADDVTVEAWDAALAGPLEGGPLVRVLCTHMHPDHIGLAGRLCRRFGARLWMTRLEYVTGRMLLADTGRAAPEDGVAFHRAAGWDEAAVERYRARFGQFGRAVSPMPDSYRRLTDGEEIEIGRRAWRVVTGSGHSPEHACLHQPELRVLIAGDQVLPAISSNVSVFPTEPDADPLADWIGSLGKLRREIPDDVLVLPSHGLPFRGLHARLEALERGHAVSLDRLERSLREPRRAVDVFGALFARPIGDGLLGMATGESLAHLNHLTREGRAVRETDADGVWWWRRP